VANNITTYECCKIKVKRKFHVTFFFRIGIFREIKENFLLFDVR